MTLATLWDQANLHVCWIVDLEAKERMIEDMRIALTEQEETQSQMEEILEDKLQLIQELSDGKTNSWTHCFRCCFLFQQKHSILKNCYGHNFKGNNIWLVSQTGFNLSYIFSPNNFCILITQIEKKPHDRALALNWKLYP